jgi:hypothetical protein
VAKVSDGRFRGLWDDEMFARQGVQVDPSHPQPPRPPPGQQGDDRHAPGQVDTPHAGRSYAWVDYRSPASWKLDPPDLDPTSSPPCTALSDFEPPESCPCLIRPHAHEALGLNPSRATLTSSHAPALVCPRTSARAICYSQRVPIGIEEMTTGEQSANAQNKQTCTARTSGNITTTQQGPPGRDGPESQRYLPQGGEVRRGGLQLGSC